jgi:hypothetical protein
MSVLNGTVFKDRLQGLSGWEGKKCPEKDIRFGAIFEEKQSQHCVFKIRPPALRLLSTVPKNSC